VDDEEGVVQHLGGIAYEEQGSGTAVVFIHGTGTYRTVYGDVADALGDGHRSIRYDRRGFGATGGRSVPWSQHLHDAAGLIEAVVGGPAVVVGNSGGGVLALQLAHRRPDLVAALVLAEPAWRTVLTPSVDATLALTRTFALWAARAHERAAVGFYRWATRYVGGGNQFDSYPEEWRTTARAHARSTLRELLQLLPPRPSSRALRSILVPTTVLVGGRGRPVFRRTARAVARRIPGAEVVTLPESAHILNTDDPEGFAAAVAATARWVQLPPSAATGA
jgi:pimeloyl-ACP methyl ester carboxylesterase